MSTSSRQQAIVAAILSSTLAVSAVPAPALALIAEGESMTEGETGYEPMDVAGELAIEDDGTPLNDDVNNVGGANDAVGGNTENTEGEQTPTEGGNTENTGGEQTPTEGGNAENTEGEQTPTGGEQTPTEGGNAENKDGQTAPTTGEAAEDATRVATVDELKAAIADSKVTSIVLDADITPNEPLTIDIKDRSLSINLDKHNIEFGDLASNGFEIASGDVTLMNGRISLSPKQSGTPIKQVGGRVTLSKNLEVSSSNSAAASISDAATMIIDGANLFSHNMTYPVISASGKAALTVLDGLLSPAEGGKSLLAEGESKIDLNGGSFIGDVSVEDESKANINGGRFDCNVSAKDKAQLAINGGTFKGDLSKDGDANITIKGGVFSKAAETIKELIRKGYVLVDGSEVKGDLASELCTVTIDPSTYAYDGKYKEPKVTVTFDGKDITDQCRFAYSDNKEVGTAKVTITPKLLTPFTGSRTATFTITDGKNNLKDASVTIAPTTYLYDGTAKEPVVLSVRLNGSIVDPKAYTVTYSNNINAGTGTVTITANGTSSTSDTGSSSSSSTDSSTDKSSDETSKTENGESADKGTENSSNSDTSKADDGIADEDALKAQSDGIEVQDESSNTTGNTNSSDTSTTGANATKDANTSTTGTNTTVDSAKDANTTSGTNNDTSGSDDSDSALFLHSVTGSVSKSFEITRRPVTVTAKSYTKTSGSADPAFAATVIGTIGSDSVSYTLTRQAGETVGSYKITPSGSETQGNYSVTYYPGYLYITGAGSSTATTGNGGTTSTTTTRATTAKTGDASFIGGIAVAFTGLASLGGGLFRRNRKK